MDIYGDLVSKNVFTAIFLLLPIQEEDLSGNDKRNVHYVLLVTCLSDTVLELVEVIDDLKNVKY